MASENLETLAAVAAKVTVQLGEDGPKESTKSNSFNVLEKARRACQNMMHVSCLVLSDPRNQMRSRMLVVTHRPFRFLGRVVCPINIAMVIHSTSKFAIWLCVSCIVVRMSHRGKRDFAAA